MELLESLEKKRARTKGKNPSLRSFPQLIATGFGLGYLPIFPGTWGSLATAVAVYGLYQLPFPHIFGIHLALALLLFPVAWYCSEKASRAMGTADPSVVVIDEVFGQALALLFVPVTLTTVIIGLILFRIFDIFKPFPVSSAERLHGGLGIVADDLIAGVYAGLVLLLLFLLHAS
jgi:phosphatidylglycerophosphatase A